MTGMNQPIVSPSGYDAMRTGIRADSFRGMRGEGERRHPRSLQEEFRSSPRSFNDSD